MIEVQLLNLARLPHLQQYECCRQLKSSNMNTIKVKKGAVVSDNFGGKRTVKEEFEAEVIVKQSDYYICRNAGKFQSGLEEIIGDKQSFFVEESDVVRS